MVKLAWATDIHLDFLDNNAERLKAFAMSLVPQDAGTINGIVLTGDISTAKHLIYHLSVIESVVQRPIYFVLGNHDYYGAPIEPVRAAMKELTNKSQFLRYLPTTAYLPLSATTAIVGHDGWYDALHGDWQKSMFSMMDWSAIHDFIPVNRNKGSIVAQARKLAHEAATYVQNGIKQAVRYHKHIVVLTHFPPFKESHIYNGQVGDDNAQPWYTSKFMGDMLLDAAKAHPDVHFTVLAGHTHGKFDGKILSNLEVHVGGAEYYEPKLQGMIELP